MNIVKQQSKFHFDYVLLRNYYVENLYWTKVASKKTIWTIYILAPILAILKYFLIRRKPTIEMILVVAKDEKLLKKIIKKLR